MTKNMNKVMHDAVVHPQLAADFIEGEHDFRVLVDLPGVELVDLSVSLTHDSILIVHAERRRPSLKEQDDQNIAVLHPRCANERVYGRLERKIPLPMYVDEATAEAAFELGVLSVNFKKRETQFPIKVPVTVSKSLL
jgi:HSP20 family protein